MPYHVTCCVICTCTCGCPTYYDIIIFDCEVGWSLTQSVCSVIYNINSAVCVGIVSATQYCQYACGRQPGKWIHSWCIHTLVPYMEVHMFVTGIFIAIVCVVLGSIVVSISACHAEDPGSIPGWGVQIFFFFLLLQLRALSCYLATKYFSSRSTSICQENFDHKFFYGWAYMYMYR